MKLYYICSQRLGFRTRSFATKITAMNKAELLYVYRDCIGNTTPIQLFIRSSTKGPIFLGEMGPWGWKWNEPQEGKDA